MLSSPLFFAALSQRLLYGYDVLYTEFTEVTAGITSMKSLRLSDLLSKLISHFTPAGYPAADIYHPLHDSGGFPGIHVNAHFR